MHCVLSICVIGLFTSITRAEIQEEDNVLVLTDKNIQEAIDAYQFVLVKFYAPWCGHCKDLAPEYAKVAEILKEKNPDIKLAKIDATENPGAARRYAIKGYPSLKFFRSGQPRTYQDNIKSGTNYKGERNSDNIINWLEMMTKPSVVDLDSIEEIDKFTKDNDVAIVGFFRDRRNWANKNYNEAAEHLYDHGYTFGFTSNKDLFDNYNVTQDDVVLFKAFEEGRVDFEGKYGWSVDLISNFIISNSLPQVIEFNPKLLPRILSTKDKGALYLVSSFSSLRSDGYASHLEMARLIAQEYENRILTVIINAKDEANKALLNKLRVTENDVPAIRFAYGMDKKYIPDTTDISETEIKKFVDEILVGRRNPILWTKSEEAPKDWNKESVKVLVGQNFHDVVNKKRNVFVDFYDSSCGRCQDFAPIWEHLGDTFKDRWDIMIAKMDGTMNELEALEISEYPTLLLFKGNAAKYVPFREEPTLKALLKFLVDQGIRPPANARDEL